MALPVPLLLLAAGAFALKTFSGNKPKGARCGHFTDEARAQSQHRRDLLASSVLEPANLAPGRILYASGEEADQGILQLIWKSDGPWGQVGCVDPLYEFRSILLSEAPLTQNPINIDVRAMLAANPWGKDHFDDELLFQRHAQGDSAGALHRIPEDVVHLADGLNQDHEEPLRRSWIEAQVAIADMVWRTKNVEWRPRPPLPHLHPCAVYGAVEGDWSQLHLGEDDNPWPTQKKVVGPDALILLRPDANGRGGMLSLYGDHFVDITMLLDPEDGDIMFFGKDWLSKKKVTDTMASNQFLQSSYAARPGQDPRPIDVLLWLVFREAEKASEAAGETTMVTKQLKFLHAIGNESGDAWVDLLTENPGWGMLLDHHYEDVVDIVDFQGANPWG
jgi:hypothetical protein